ncbi:P-loop containing nucleoside triphosphate hydrolase protein [Xylariaceae sp. FL0255]|nr:P-loop containing nucleoside triphosphate hydrolase protein [Xylariaceae sp. FL0255]
MGEISFKCVKLIYPSRSDVIALDGLDITSPPPPPPRKATAVVGASGCGKSSIIGLLERFYRPVGGTVSEPKYHPSCYSYYRASHSDTSIALDGSVISSSNLRWPRQQMALVGTGPVQFKASIYENIRYGLSLTSKHRSAFPKHDEYNLVVRAAIIAHAHELISQFSHGHDNQVGEEGLESSGSQLQRIAITRALIKDPKILLLDEATAASFSAILSVTGLNKPRFSSLIASQPFVMQIR